MVRYILMPEETIQKIKKGNKFFVNGEFNPNAARLITAAHDAYFWVDDNNMPHWTVDAMDMEKSASRFKVFLIQPRNLAVFFLVNTAKKKAAFFVRAEKQNIVLRCSPGCNPGGVFAVARSPAYIYQSCFADRKIRHIGNEK